MAAATTIDEEYINSYAEITEAIFENEEFLNLENKPQPHEIKVTGVINKLFKKKKDVWYYDSTKLMDPCFALRNIEFPEAKRITIDVASEYKFETAEFFKLSHSNDYRLKGEPLLLGKLGEDEIVIEAPCDMQLLSFFYYDEPWRRFEEGETIILYRPLDASTKASLDAIYDSEILGSVFEEHLEEIRTGEKKEDLFTSTGRRRSR